MRIPLQVFKENEKILTFSEADSWIKALVKGFEEVPNPELKNSKSNIQVSYLKSSTFYWVKGQIELQFGLLCSRCTEPFSSKIDAQFSRLFSTDKRYDDSVTLEPVKSSSEEDLQEIELPFDSTNPEQTIPDDISYISKDFIDLEELLTELVQLQLPFRPLCRENCKGLCQQCGTNRNEVECNCKTEPEKSSPFSTLKNFHGVVDKKN